MMLYNKQILRYDRRKKKKIQQNWINPTKRAWPDYTYDRPWPSYLTLAALFTSLDITDFPY